MLASVQAAAQQPVFPVQNLIILAIVVAVVYPLQKKLRETVSRRRRERWAEEDRQAEPQRQQQGAPAHDDPSRPSEDRTRTSDDPSRPTD